MHFGITEKPMTDCGVSLYIINFNNAGPTSKVSAEIAGVNAKIAIVDNPNAPSPGNLRE